MLTHLARNADSVVWRLEGAAAGELRDQYPGGLEQRARRHRGRRRPAGGRAGAPTCASSVGRRRAGRWPTFPPPAWDAPSRTSRGVVEDSRDAVLRAGARWWCITATSASGPVPLPPALVEAWLPRELPRLAERSDPAELLAWVIGRGEPAASWRRPGRSASRRTRCPTGPRRRSRTRSGTRCSSRAWPLSIRVPALHVVPFQAKTRPMESTARQKVVVGHDDAGQARGVGAGQGRLGGDGRGGGEDRPVPGQDVAVAVDDDAERGRGAGDRVELALACRCRPAGSRSWPLNTEGPPSAATQKRRGHARDLVGGAPGADVAGPARCRCRRTSSPRRRW